MAPKQHSSTPAVQSAGSVDISNPTDEVLQSRAGANIAQQPELFALLKELAQAVVRTFGEELCEVVIHDLADLEHSIVWIEGDVTHRHIGGSMTDLGLELVQAGNTENLFVYRSNVDGKLLQSSSVFLRNADGTAWGSFCINFDITALHNFQRFLEMFAQPATNAEIKETFSDDITETVQRLITECTSRIGKSPAELSREDRLDLVRMLEQKGAFLVRRSVPIIASSLNVSRYTIYNYLAELRGDAAPRADAESPNSEE